MLLPTMLLFGVGCASAPAASRPDPAGASQAWIEALSSGDPARVWAMLGDGARAPWPDATAFDAWCRRRCPDLLVSAMSATEVPREGVALEGGIRVVREADGWRVHDPGLAGPQTVRGALRALRARGAAWLSREALLRLDEAIDAPDSAVKVEGARADVQLSGDRRVTLSKEASGWRVDGWH